MNTETRTPMSIDGSLGEGGGQILRTALTLSMLTGRAFQLTNIRAGRKKPGLMRQHLVCIEAAQRISNAYVEGATLNSQRIFFQPQHLQAGVYDFHIGSAGSSTLVLQTLLPALMMQKQASKLTIHGGTHNPLAPSADFIAHCFLPCLRQLGVDTEFLLHRAGYFPIGAGEISIVIHPVQRPQHAIKLSKDKPYRISAYASCLNLEPHIAQRELEVLANKLTLHEAKQQYLQGISYGNSLYVHIKAGQHQQVLSALGQKGITAERIAKNLAKQVQSYLDSPALADEFLTDQLLLPMLLLGGGEFSAQMVSEHSRTQAEMIQKFLNCKIDFIEDPQGFYNVIVKSLVRSYA